MIKNRVWSARRSACLSTAYILSSSVVSPSTQATQSHAKEVRIGRVMLHFRNRFCVLIETVCIEDSEHKFDERFAFDP